MQREDCLKKDGKENTCLCFKEKDRYVFCVMMQCRFSKSTPNKESNIAQELKGKLWPQQSVFTVSMAKNNVAMKASFIVAEEIAHTYWSFSEGAFLKQCILKVCEQVSPDQIQIF